MSDFWNTKDVVTKKPHRCEGCLKEFPAGSKLEYNAGKWNGEMNSYYLCSPCRSFIDENDSVSDTLRDEGFAAGDIGEWRKEREEEEAEHQARSASV